MSLKLQKEHIRLTEVLCSGYCHTTVEGDVIVPDIKPDILKILQADGCVAINKADVQNDKVLIMGKVKLTILYLPDLKDPKCVKSIVTEYDFAHTIDVLGAKPGMDICAEARCEDIEYTLLNSRKLNIKTRLGICARLSAGCDISLPTGAADEEAVEIKTRRIKVQNPIVTTTRDIILRERMEIPDGKPAAAEILKLSVGARVGEAVLMTDKAQLKGEAKINTLYLSEADEMEIMEYSIPFCEILEVGGISEQMNGEMEITAKDFSYEISQDSDGDNRIIRCEIKLCVAVKAWEMQECNLIEDAFGTNTPVEIKWGSRKIEQFTDSKTEKLPIKELVAIPDYLPGIVKMCEVNANAVVEGVSTDERTVSVNGLLSCSFLYLSKDETTPISGFSHILPFVRQFEIEGMKENSVCEAKADVESISCTISGDKELEIRALIEVSIRVTSTSEIKFVEEIVCTAEENPQKLPSAAIYFVQKEDTLWSVAKRHRISVDALASINGVDKNEALTPRQCIYIFR